MNQFTKAFSVTLFATTSLLGGCLDAEQGEEADESAVEAEPTAESASEVSSPWFCIPGACVRFESYGDHLFVNDNSSSYNDAIGQIAGYGTCWNNLGTGSTKDCNFNTAETYVSIRACRGNFNTQQINACGPWFTVSAKN